MESLQKESWMTSEINGFEGDEIKQVNRMKKGNVEFGKEGEGIITTMTNTALTGLLVATGNSATPCYNSDDQTDNSWYNTKQSFRAI